MSDIKPEDYAKTKEEYKSTIRLMAKAAITDSFRSLVFANNSLSLGLQAFGVDVAEEVALAMTEELEKINKSTKKTEEDKSQIAMEFYPKSGEVNEYPTNSPGCRQ